MFAILYFAASGARSFHLQTVYMVSHDVNGRMCRICKKEVSFLSGSGESDMGHVNESFMHSTSLWENGRKFGNVRCA